MSEEIDYQYEEEAVPISQTGLGQWLAERMHIIQPVLLFALFVFALLFRFGGLGASPLSEPEAQIAMQALQVGTDGFDADVTQPLYVTISALFFALFGDSETSVRLFSAICGFLLIFLPFLFTKQLGIKRSYIFALLICFDPALIYWSKTADGLMPAILISAAVLGAVIKQRKTLTWVLLGIDLSSGCRLWPFLITMVVLGALQYRRMRANDQTLCETIRMYLPYPSLKNVLLLAAAWLLSGNAFFSFSKSLGAAGNGFLRSFDAIQVSQRLDISAWCISAVVYYGFILVLLLWVALRRFQRSEPCLLRILGFVVLFCVLMLCLQQNVLIFPWLGLILCGCGALAFSECEMIYAPRQLPIFILSALILPVACAFLCQRVAELLRMSDLSLPLVIIWRGVETTLPFSRFNAYLFIIAISILICTLIAQVLSSYFEVTDVRSGLVLGVFVLFAAVETGNAWATAGFHNQQDDPFTSQVAARHEPLLGMQSAQTDSPLVMMVKEIGLKSCGSEFCANGLVSDIEDPMLTWALRKFYGLSYSSLPEPVLDAQSYVITKGVEKEASMAGYKGMFAPWRTKDTWNDFSAMDWLNWLFFREAVQTKQTLLLWQQTNLLNGNN